MRKWGPLAALSLLVGTACFTATEVEQTAVHRQGARADVGSASCEHCTDQRV